MENLQKKCEKCGLIQCASRIQCSNCGRKLTKDDTLTSAEVEEFHKNENERIENEGIEIETSSFWVTGMKVFAWITFTATIIGGIVFGFIVGQESAGIGFLIFIASIILAFLSVALLMIYLDMARDISEIKGMLKNRR